ncbi:MAG: hypothetical protein JW994_07495, partial [Candidatus Omnitrophica bacterium]|nr:hypothetical protein [Candidatus Omnitrophota bacterium]
FTLRRQQADEPPLFYVSGEDAHGRRPGAGGLRPCRVNVEILHYKEDKVSDPNAWGFLMKIEKSISRFNKSSTILSICMIVLAITQLAVAVVVYLKK